MGSRTYVVVPHTHWDREWYLPFQRFRLRLVGLMDRVLELTRTHEAFRFTVDGQMAAVEDYLEIRPERREELAALVRAGRVAVGPWLVLADEWLTSAESLLRNLEMGQAAASALGGSMPVAYLPDQFGHVAQMPQLLARAGFDRVVLWRGVPEAVRDHRFSWVAPDGSEVLAEYLPSGYGNAMPLERARSVEELSERLAEVERVVGAFYPDSTPVLAMMGTDHFVPTAALVDRLSAAGLELTTLPEALDRLDEAASDREPLRWQGELRSAARANLLADVVSTRWHLKAAMTALERRLERTVEPVAALWGAAWPEAELALAWRWCVQCSNHDSVTGCGADETADDVAQRLRHARELADGLAEQAFVVLAGEVPAGELAVWNPSPFAREEVVMLTLPDHDEATPALLDADGRGWTTQELGRARGLRRLAALASAPALGWQRWGPVPARSEHRPPAAVMGRSEAAGDVVLDNGAVSVRLGPSGRLRLAHRDGAVAEGVLRVIDEGEAGDSYTHAPPELDTVVTEARWGRVQLVHTGPLLASAHLDLVYDWPTELTPDRRRRSTATSETTVGIDVELRLGEPFVRMGVGFDNACSDHRVRLVLPLAEPASEVAVEGQLAVVERRGPTEGGHGDAPVTTHPARGFADAGGLGVLLDCVREVELVDERTLAVTLLRSTGWLSRDDNARRTEPAGPELAIPGAQCLGPVTARFALLPHDGNWEAGGLVEAAERFSHPLEVVPGVGDATDDASLPAARTGLSFSGNASGVVLSALRRRGEWLEIRLAAERSRPAEVALRFGDVGRPVEARRADLLGRPGAALPLDVDGSLRLSLAPFEIATVQVRVEHPA